MRVLVAGGVLLLAAAVSGKPVAIGRVALVAGGYLAAQPTRVSVRVPGGAAALARAGFSAEAMSADVAALSATPAELARLLALPDVMVVEEARTLTPLLDVSALAIGAPAARQATGLDGSGVLVGVVDTGLDLAHADFRRADGKTRVVALLDLGKPRTLHPELPDYGGGELFLGTDIDGGRADSRDWSGHGTHVAGIAAASGLANGRGLPAGRYVGIAPGAELVIAQARRDGATGFAESDIATACRFILDTAARLGRPVVVNLSLGGAGGGHDGSSNFELALDQLFPPDGAGRALVVAAGNDGNRDNHAGAAALDGRLGIPVEVTPQPLSVEVWYRGTLLVSLSSPSGKRSTAVAPGQLASDDTGEGIVVVDNASTGPHLTGKRSASIVVMGPKRGTWSLILDGKATRWDAYVTLSASHFLGALSEDGRLGLPATAHNAIVVGSFVTKNRWTTAADMAAVASAFVDEVSSFSSSGPTADGRFAPDLIAPGEYVASARSADATFDDLTYVADDGAHVLMRGTSQAAPHVAGAAALLFAADPTLTPAALREILRVSARDQGAGFSPRRGFGRLDVGAALDYLRGARASVASAEASSVGVSRDLVPPGDETTVVSVTPRGGDGTPLGPGHAVTIRASAGAFAGGVADTGFGRYERTFYAHAPRGTVAVISASVDGVALAAHPAVFIVDARADVGAAFAARGGCALSPAPALPALALVILAAALLVWRRAGQP